MSLQIYNSLTQKKEEFIPQKPAQVSLYSCGVTVYDDCHIGHARSLYIFDVIRRYLGSRGLQVRFVRNITDIDDKIINRANELKTDWRTLVGTYIDRYYQDLAAMGIGQADIEPRATENIGEMIKDIQILIDKGFAYPTASGVYFSVRKFKEYGKLSGQSVEQMLTGVRKEADETKEDALDFALWKTSKPGEPFWPSPWGDGRPGWHIECSVMSTKYLKTDTLDIHAGGRDLIFPHHENEIAQSEALTGKPFARYWIHHGLLTINGQKMSKSLGNFVTIQEFLKKHRHPELLKLFFLSAHYSHPIDYNEDKIIEARQALERISILFNKMEEAFADKSIQSPETAFKEIDEIRNKFIAAMDDDFNTPQGMACVFDLVNLANKNIDNQAFLRSARKLFAELLDIFSLDFSRIASLAGGSSTSENAIIENLIVLRNEARKNRDFKEADKLRKQLEAQGVVLEDTKDGTTWRRKL